MSQLAILDTAAITTAGPFGGTWTTGFVGYIASASNLSTYTPGLIGSATPVQLTDVTVKALGYLLSANQFMIYLASGPTQNSLFSQVFTTQGAHTGQYQTTQATYYAPGVTTYQGATIASTTGPIWLWADANSDFTSGSLTTLTFIITTPAAPAGNGDITDSSAWQDAAGNIPPLQFSQVPYNVNYPLNGDGRYWFQANATATSAGGPITFIGSAS